MIPRFGFSGSNISLFLSNYLLAPFSFQFRFQLFLFPNFLFSIVWSFKEDQDLICWKEKSKSFTFTH